jgi:hypothetical protein
MIQQASTEGKVQQCGCIALPEEFRAQTGLYPGATYTLEVAEAGAVVLLRILEPSQQAGPNLSASCG